MAELLFDSEEHSFTMQSHGVTMQVERLKVPGYAAFRILFSSQRKPITIVRARDSNAAKFWTVIPEGQDRETEAQGVGLLIEEYYKQKEKK